MRTSDKLSWVLVILILLSIGGCSLRPCMEQEWIYNKWDTDGNPKPVYKCIRRLGDARPTVDKK